MKSIGFKNFRRFQNFEPVDINGITFLVGRNNAGKSTLVKALLLINSYFKSGQIESLSFGNHVLEDANIITYGRAKNQKAKENKIDFIYNTDNFEVTISITGEDDNTNADVHLLKIIDNTRSLVFQFHPQTKTVSIAKTDQSNNDEEGAKFSILSNLEKDISELTEVIANSSLKKSDKEFIELLDSLNALQNKRNQITHGAEEAKNEDNEEEIDLDSIGNEPRYEYELNEVESEITHFKVETEYSAAESMSEIIEFIIEESLKLHGIELIKAQKGEDTVSDFDGYRGIKQNQPEIEKSFEEFLDSLFGSELIYLGANPSKQSALFSIRDTNNALSQSINEFFQIGIEKGSALYLFVQKWMREFEVGDSFDITFHAGEAYELNVSSNNTLIPLADKGMGSIQAMLLLLRMAVILHKKQKYRVSSTVVIEEPELNLHPALQSKLADLFYEVKEEYKIDFIIETHSEYILRRSQVLVAEKELEISPNENPFCIHYFPKDLDHQPYRLEYQKDGTLNKNFGDGFFDEAASSTLELLRLKRAKKS